MDELYIKLRKYAQDPTNYRNPYIIQTPSRFQEGTGDLHQGTLQYATSPLENFTIDFKDPLELTSDFFMYDYDFNEPTKLLDCSFDSNAAISSSSSLTRIGEDFSDLKTVYSPVMGEVNHHLVASTIDYQPKDLLEKSSISPKKSIFTAALPLFDCNDQENTLINHNLNSHSLPNTTTVLKSNTSSVNLNKKRKAPLSRQSLDCSTDTCDDFSKSAQKSDLFSFPPDESKVIFTSSGRMSVKKARK